MRNFLANYNLCAVSANSKESAINTEQTLDTSLLIAKSDIMDLDQRREDNKNELTGKEEADTIYDLGAFSNFSLNFEKAQAQHFGFGYAFALGSRSVAGYGGGYKHSILPTADFSNPSFTAAMRYGKTLNKRRFASSFIDTLTATFGKDAWAKLVLGTKGTGKYTDSMANVTIAGAFNATSLTLSLAVTSITRSGTTATVTTTKEHTLGVGMGITVSGVTGTDANDFNISGTILSVISKTQFTYTVVNSTGAAAGGTIVVGIAIVGSDAATRLDNVHSIRVKVPSTAEWQEVVYSIASSATPAIITMAAPGGAATSTDYEILFLPTEATWCTFPSRVVEPPLRVTDLVMKIGGKWDGAAFQGGRTIDVEIDSIEHVLNNQMSIEFRPGGTGKYANYAMRGGREQTLKLNRQMRDFILEQRMKDNEYFGVYLKATGAEFESGKNYYVQVIFPRCGVIKATKSVSDKVIAEAGDLKVLEDDTYGSVLVEVANKVATYAA